MLNLDAKKTALVVIDLQEGILPFAGGPHTADDVVARAARLAEKCRAVAAPVVLVRVGWSADFGEALKQPVDAPAPAKALPSGSIRLQLAGMRSQKEARALAERVSKDFGTALGGHRFEIAQAVYGNMGTFYHARFGPYSEATEPTACRC